MFKSLILPNITFIGSCTIIPKEYIQTFKNIVYEFLWKGKKDPVKRSVLSNDYLEGRLKMTNIDTYIKALQIKWILRLLENSNENWKIIPQKYFENIGENFLIFNMNLDSFKSLENELTKNIPAFYKELLKTWITCRGRENKSPHNFREIRKQIIWGNKYIKYKGKCLVKVNWIKSGIIFINDILDKYAYGHISEYKIIAKLRNKQNWISELNILKKAIPKLWKETLITQDSIKTQVIPKKYVKIEKNQIQNLQIKNKEVYKILLESQVKEKPIAYTKWGKCLKKDRMHTLTCITQTLFFTFNYLELNKLKIFKWKLIHFILSCKELLKQWRILNNSDCLVCKEKENYKHLYLDCKYSKKYWQEVKKMTTNLYIGDHVFNLESLVFGYNIYDQAYFDLNLLITLIFFSIYN